MGRSAPPPAPSALLLEGACRLGVRLDGPAVERFSGYLQTLLEWSARVNLTALRGPEQIVRSGFLDSLTCLPLVPPGTARIVDIGSGAGFPAIPLAIAYNHATFTLIEATRRKVTFLRHVVRTLGLAHVTVLHDRAEICAEDPAHAEGYDVAFARAAATLPAQAALVAPFLRHEGVFLAQVAPPGAAALEALTRLGFTLARTVHPALSPAHEILVLRVAKMFHVKH